MKRALLLALRLSARTVLIHGITFGVLAAIDPGISVAADRRLQAMQFELVHEGPAEVCASSCDTWVSATGVITEHTPEEFDRFAKQNDVRGAVIALDSAGGSVRAGLSLGRAIRRLEMITTVAKTINLPSRSDANKRAMLSPWATCESMCAFVLLAGVERHVPEDAQVLVHDIWLGDRRTDPIKATYSAVDVAVVQRDVTELARYTIEMGGTFALLEVSLKVPPWEPMHQLSRAELRAMNMATIENLPSGTAFSSARVPMPSGATASLDPSTVHTSEGDGAKRPLGKLTNSLPK